MKIFETLNPGDAAAASEPAVGPGPSWTSYLVLDLGEDGAGPVEEPLGEPHLVLVVLVAPLAHRGVLPLLEPLVLDHGQDGHAGLPCGQRSSTLVVLTVVNFEQDSLQ